MFERVLFAWVKVGFLEKENVVAIGDFFDVSYYVAVARALDWSGGVVREGVKVVGDTGGRGEEEGGMAARGKGRHWDQEEEVDFGER